jgi:prolyl oligopeptidase
VALSSVRLSDDGTHLAYGVADGGSDWNVWRVREIATGKDLGEELRWIKFVSPAWSNDGTGFYYGRYDAPAEGSELEAVNYHQKLYYHALNTPQSADQLVYERKDQKEWQFSPMVTEDGRYLVIDVSQGTDPRNRVFYRDLADRTSPVVELLSDFDANYSFLGNEGSTFLFFTNLDAPRGRIIAIDTEKPARDQWKELVPHAAETLSSVSLVGDQFIASYLKDAQSLIRVFDLSGKPVREVRLPGVGTAAGFGGRRTDRETFYAFSGFTMPGAIYRYDLASGKSEPFRAPKLLFDPAAYTTEQVFYASKDGTRVPMFLTYKKGLQRNGKNPTLLYAYGGFNVSLTPHFNPARIAWIERGGIYAVANLRGGGEYGEEWHEAGTKLKKQNVFDDFIAGAEWLIANGYTSTPKLAIAGGSNGGLLVMAAATQRPELFEAVVCRYPLVDMLRYHKFLVGSFWVPEYGNPDLAEEFPWVYAYSPYHRVQEGTTYPATLFITGDADTRVAPLHARKMTALMQAVAANGAEEPILLRYHVSGGHSGGEPLPVQVKNAAEELGFMWWQLR